MTNNWDDELHILECNVHVQGEGGGDHMSNLRFQPNYLTPSPFQFWISSPIIY